MATINGSSKNDLLNGTLMNDIINGKSGKDTLYGSDGNDTMDGGSENDLLYGGIGNDNMSGGSGNSDDKLYGEAGNDWLDGDSGNDTLDGGSGVDTLNGGSGNDLLAGDDGIMVFASANLVVNGSFEADDVASGSWGVFGGGLTGWQTSLGAGPEIQDSIYGTADGPQYLELDSYNNSNISQDVATGGTGEFLLEFQYTPRPGVDSASNPIEVWWNGTLLDTLTGDSFGWATHSYVVTGAGATTELEFRAAGTEDSLGGLLDAVSVRAIESSADVLNGGSGNDTINGGAGNDSLTGDSGNDLMNGGDGNDTLAGDSGADTLNGGAGNDSMTGHSGADTLNGNDGEDVLLGSSGDDALNGGAGDDDLTGGANVDTLTGGAGSDVFHYTGLGDSEVGATDLITDWETGIDHIDLAGLGFTGIAAGAASGSVLGFTFDGTNTVITDANSDFSIALAGNHTLSDADFYFA